MAMPRLLKLLTAAAAIPPIVCIGSMIPHRSIGVFGRNMTTSQWWDSGAGLATLFASCLIIAAALLMLKRSRHGRPVYILAWVTMTLIVPLTARLVRADFATAVPSLVSNLVLTGVIGVYLYKSAAVKRYFGARPDS